MTRRQPMPDRMKAAATDAKARHRVRPSAVPRVRLEEREGRWEPVSPYREQDDWEALIFDAFGTASESVVSAFMHQLQGLVGEYHDGKRWRPDEFALTAALNVIRSTNPANEMEAALAAQMVAVHLLTMRASREALSDGFMSPLTASVASRLARTSAQQMLALAKLQGRSAPQEIVVRYEKHVHNHTHVHHHDERHLHLTGGSGDLLGQPCGPTRLPPRYDASRSALSGPQKGREPLSEAGDQGEAALPDPRLRKGRGGAEGREERGVEDGGLDQRGRGVPSGGRPRLKAVQGRRA